MLISSPIIVFSLLNITVLNLRPVLVEGVLIGDRIIVCGTTTKSESPVRLGGGGWLNVLSLSLNDGTHRAILSPLPVAVDWHGGGRIPLRWRCDKEKVEFAQFWAVPSLGGARSGMLMDVELSTIDKFALNPGALRSEQNSKYLSQMFNSTSVKRGALNPFDNELRITTADMRAKVYFDFHATPTGYELFILSGGRLIKFAAPMSYNNQLAWNESGNWKWNFSGQFHVVKTRKSTLLVTDAGEICSISTANRADSVEQITSSAGIRMILYEAPHKMTYGFSSEECFVIDDTITRKRHGLKLGRVTNANEAATELAVCAKWLKR